MENISETHEKLHEEISQLNKRLDSIECKLNNKPRNSLGDNIWVLVPVAAIIMWGLTNIY
ncbi:hypothetical protein [Pontibacillus sp. HMF3514]|uniref:hypothetical protein n=1 Tax=Pontibacillus sp. HMF3514 TaxID=2692425 RepID=UPI00131FF201|nr:hypothetical protein [Pontibacillus sp. HMF3514]QHE52649.1 hypothetical protein GS400_11665 [Pontibacillus sp. HMF3514]